jgi:hypothetical protein
MMNLMLNNETIDSGHLGISIVSHPSPHGKAHLRGEHVQEYALENLKISKCLL